MIKFFQNENGFTLIESIIATILVSLAISGILMGWYLMESKDRSLENYWNHKESLELAFQITHQTLRSSAILSTVTVINGGQGLSFMGIDGVNRTFFKEGNHYKFFRSGREEVLLRDICDNAVFVLNGDQVNITLGVTVPPNWNGDDDLNTEGTVYIRNP